MKENFSAVVHKEENMYVAECPEVGTFSQGKTVEDAIFNLREATELYLEEFPIKPISRPIMTFFEVATNATIKKAIRAWISQNSL